MKKINVLTAFLFILGSAVAQQTIRGKVTDAVNHQPLESVTIREEGNPGRTTISDEYGNFTLTTSSSKVNLTISFAGYKTLSATTGNSNTLKIALQPGSISLQDVQLNAKVAAKFATLSRIDLDLKPVRNTQELLRVVPGLFIAQHAGGGKAEQIFLRGFDCDHGTDVQVSVDGIPINMVSHAHGQGYADSHFIIPETVNSVDFGAGPYYSNHGDLNTAGHVAFSTFKSIPRTLVQLEGGRFNTYRALAMIDLLKRDKAKQSAYIASEFNYTDGPTENKQHFNRLNVFGKYNLQVTDKTSFNAAASAFKSKWDASGQVPERAVESGMIGRFGSIDPTEGGNTERYNANISLVHRFAQGTTWENQAYYSRYIFNLYSNFTFYLNDPVNADEINQAEKRNILGYNSRLTSTHSFGKLNLRSSYGAGLRYDATKDSKLANVVQRQFLSNIKLGDIKELNGFGYMQQQANFGKWLVEAGVRFDYFHFDYLDKLSAVQNPAQQKSIFSPKLNIQYTLTPAVQLYAKTGKGFHSNDARVVVANDGKELLPAAYGSDLGIILKPTKNFYLNIAAWLLYLEQEFVYVGDDGNIEPSGRSRRQGIDVIARYQFSKYLFANANINFTKPRAPGEAKGQDYIPLAPTATSTGGIFYKRPAGFNGSLTYRYIKSRPANEDNSIVAKGYYLMDASVNYAKRKYEIGLALENIFNNKWNEAQFATESRLMNEPNPITELNFTPGSPFFARLKLAVFF